MKFVKILVYGVNNLLIKVLEFDLVCCDLMEGCDKILNNEFFEIFI